MYESISQEKFSLLFRFFEASKVVEEGEMMNNFPWSQGRGEADTYCADIPSLLHFASIRCSICTSSTLSDYRNSPLRYNNRFYRKLRNRIHA